MTSGYLLLADIDNFKNVNDIYGHQSGDNVLCEVAERLSNNVRHFDILARFGGEEFIIFVPTKSEEAAVLFSQRLIRVIAENSFFISSYNINLKITMSLGAVYVENINFNCINIISPESKQNVLSNGIKTAKNKSLYEKLLDVKLSG